METGFTGVERTSLVTLYLRALESRSRDSLLTDRAAEEAVRRLGPGFVDLKMRIAAGDRYLVALRARQLDLWAADFLSAHPGAVVAQLGCGLDTRALRLDLPPGTLWFDVDFPEVVALRGRLFPGLPARPGYRMVGASVTDPRWSQDLPRDRPALVIAEGLLMYLSEPNVRRLLLSLTELFPTGALIFDGLRPWVVKVSHTFPRVYGDFTMNWAIRTPADVTRLNPRLHPVTDTAVISQYPLIPSRPYRTLYRLLTRIPPMRDMMRLYHFSF